MRINRQARREAKELFRSCQVDGILDDARVRRALALVVERQPRGYLAVLTHFQRLVRLDIARRTARVESALALSAEQQAAVSANLTRAYGAGLSLAFAPNPDLIGGMRVRVGSDVYDGSIRGRLAALQDQF